MKMHLETSTQNLISHYGTGVLGVDGVDYDGPIMIAGGRVIRDWFDGTPDDLAHRLTLQDFAPILELKADKRPEICLLGTGTRHIFPDFSLFAGLRDHGVALEVMNTRAACRTYSVLVSEERVVAVAMLQID